MTEPFGPPPDLSPAGPRHQQRGIRLPQLLLSLLVVAVFALLAVWWQANTTSRVPALALANDVSIGVPLTRADLTEIYVNTDVPARVEDPQFIDLFVGVSPVADLEAGTLITGAMFRRSAALGPNEGMAGLRLNGDEGPSGLAAGDRVQVLVTDDDEPEGVRILAPDARVEAVTSADSGERLIRLRMGVDQAQQVQLAADDVVLIEVDNTGPASWEIEGS